MAKKFIVCLIVLMLLCSTGLCQEICEGYALETEHGSCLAESVQTEEDGELVDILRLYYDDGAVNVVENRCLSCSGGRFSWYSDGLYCSACGAKFSTSIAPQSQYR